MKKRFILIIIYAFFEKFVMRTIRKDSIYPLLIFVKLRSQILDVLRVRFTVNFIHVIQQFRKRA